MRSILGIDAAWTAAQPSGVALIQARNARSRVLCVAPSYGAFVEAGRGIAVEWDSDRLTAGAPDIPALLEAARSLGADSIDVIALDIPLARTSITKRRPSDSAISRAFGAQGCAAHSPSALRPGPISDELNRQLRDAGFRLDTAKAAQSDVPRAIEVYPHPALLGLLKRDFRVPYKVANTTKYWRRRSLQDRKARILTELTHIYRALRSELGELQFELPASADGLSLSYLKRFEDALDALVCTWVGLQHLLRRTRPYGDHESAIWVPTSTAASSAR